MNIALNYISQKQADELAKDIPPAERIRTETRLDAVKVWKSKLVQIIQSHFTGIGPNDSRIASAKDIAQDDDNGWLLNFGNTVLTATSRLFGNQMFDPNAKTVGAMFAGVEKKELTELGKRLVACNERIDELLIEKENEKWADKDAYDKAVKEGFAYDMSAEEFKEFNKDRGKWYVDKLIGYIDKYKKSGGSKEVDAMLFTDFNKTFVDVSDAKAIKMLVRRYVAEHKKEVLKRLENG